MELLQGTMESRICIVPSTLGTEADYVLFIYINIIYIYVCVYVYLCVARLYRRKTSFIHHIVI